MMMGTPIAGGWGDGIGGTVAQHSGTVATLNKFHDATYLRNHLPAATAAVP